MVLPVFLDLGHFRRASIVATKSEAHGDTRQCRGADAGRKGTFVLMHDYSYTWSLLEWCDITDLILIWGLVGPPPSTAGDVSAIAAILGKSSSWKM